MPFKQIDINNKEITTDRNCIIVYNFQGKELQAIKNFSSMLSIRDQIFINSKNENSKIKDILENNILTDSNGTIKEKAIIFNSISPAKINVFIENVKKIKISNILFATVTETSKDWTVNTLITNLAAERKAIKSGNFNEHI
jgi:hypothetical protein